MNQDELCHNARQIMSLESEYERAIRPQYGITFQEWILRSNTIKTPEEFNRIYEMGRIFGVCDSARIPHFKQPCNTDHFQILARYINNAPLLLAIWQTALSLAHHDPMQVNLQILSTSSEMCLPTHGRPVRQSPYPHTHSHHAANHYQHPHHTHQHQPHVYSLDHQSQPQHVSQSQQPSFLAPVPALTPLSNRNSRSSALSEQSYVPPPAAAAAPRHEAPPPSHWHSRPAAPTSASISSSTSSASSSFSPSFPRYSIRPPVNSYTMPFTSNQPGTKKRGRKKKSMQVPDHVILAYWKENLTSTYLAVQNKFSVGYQRVKRLKQQAQQEHNADANVAIGRNTKHEAQQSQSQPLPTPPAPTPAQQPLLEAFDAVPIPQPSLNPSLQPSLQSSQHHRHMITSSDDDRDIIEIDAGDKEEEKDEEVIKPVQQPLHKPHTHGRPVRQSPAACAAARVTVTNRQNGNSAHHMNQSENSENRHENREHQQKKEIKKESKKRKRSVPPLRCDSVSSYHSTDSEQNAVTLDELEQLRLLKKPRRTPPWIQKTHKALDHLKKDVASFYFLQPVNKIKCNATDYDLVIQTPMDLQTLSRKLTTDAYASLSEFIMDMELIYINAKIYNPPKHTVHIAAEKLQKLIKSTFQPIVAEYGDSDTMNRWDFLERPGGFAFGPEHKKAHATISK